jgi:hypothetical protein
MLPSSSGLRGEVAHPATPATTNRNASPKHSRLAVGLVLRSTLNYLSTHQPVTTETTLRDLLAVSLTSCRTTDATLQPDGHLCQARRTRGPEGGTQSPGGQRTRHSWTTRLTTGFFVSLCHAQPLAQANCSGAGSSDRTPCVRCPWKNGCVILRVRYSLLLPSINLGGSPKSVGLIDTSCATPADNVEGSLTSADVDWARMSVGGARQRTR